MLELTPEAAAQWQEQQRANQLRTSMIFELYINLVSQNAFVYTDDRTGESSMTSMDDLDRYVELAVNAIEVFVKKMN